MIHSEAGGAQLASGVVMGMWLGFVPTFSLLTVFFFLCLLIFRMNWGMTFLALAVFKPLSFLLDPFFDQLGFWLLTQDSLFSLWTQLEQTPFVPFTRFYNTIVMGSLGVCLGLSLPLFGISVLLIQRYRTHIVSRIKNSSLWRACTATNLYHLYEKYISS